jgi:hypothetical protein
VHRNYGNANSNVGHNLVLQGYYQPHFDAPSMHFANGFEFSTMTYLNSGFPINELAGTDLNDEGVSNDRPLFVARNSLTGRGLKEEDAQLKRYINIREGLHLAVFIESENLFNTNNLN